MDQADGNTTKDRLSLCLSDVLLQLDEPVGHVIEGMSELAEFIGRVDSHTLFEMAARERARSARQREDWIDEAAAPEIADDQHRQQRKRDRDFKLSLQRNRNREGFRLWLFDDDGPAQRWDGRAYAQYGTACIGVFSVRGAVRFSTVQQFDQRMRRHLVPARDTGLLIRVAVREKLTFTRDHGRIASVSDADAIHHPPEFL